MLLEQKLETGKFAVIAEMEPPKGTRVADLVAHAKRVKDRVAAFLVPEMNHAVMRMSALGGAMVLQAQGMDAVMQVCCRDRNRLALQGDLLAAAACGVESVVVVGGEDTSHGDHHQARAVHDIGPLELLEAIGKMRQGRDMAGVDLDGPPRFLVGATTNAGARGRSLEIEVEEISRTAAAGAQFVITPPVFDLEQVRPVMRRVDPAKVAVVPTVLLLKSLGMARYMERNMPHLYIPPDTIDRIQRAPDKVRECVRIAVELAQRIKAEGFPGVVLSTLGWEHKLQEIVEAI
ncbi:MAG: methylenetetrahydrofolate reductase [Desulfobacterales bacterium]|jgi:5,10-methylenetetrahydrofolate reductase|nr:methylenetetrahydrofolate reductase [Desulfobacterales bacterium]